MRVTGLPDGPRPVRLFPPSVRVCDIGLRGLFPSARRAGRTLLKQQIPLCAPAHKKSASSIS